MKHEYKRTSFVKNLLEFVLVTISWMIDLNMAIK